MATIPVEVSGVGGEFNLTFGPCISCVPYNHYGEEGMRRNIEQWKVDHNNELYDCVLCQPFTAEYRGQTQCRHSHTGTGWGSREYRASEWVSVGVELDFHSIWRHFPFSKLISRKPFQAVKNVGGIRVRERDEKTGSMLDGWSSCAGWVVDGGR